MGRSQGMLPSSLLTVWKRKGVILPRYAKLTSYNLEVASALIEAYKRALGEKKKVLREFVGELEDSGQDYRFVRGLSFLLDKQSIFSCSDKAKPLDLRRKVFGTAEKFGLPTTPEQRKQMIEEIAFELKASSELLEELLYADLDSELILEKFESLSPEDLLRRYNLSLTQTLLFESTELRFTASANWQRIFYVTKRLGLIYDAYEDGGFWVRIDGPASLFKLTRRYGTAMAKLLPAIVATSEWKVEAKILWKYTNEICDFKIESWKHRALLETHLLPVAFDSAVEEDFAARFQALNSSWLLKRELEPVLAGKKVLIPDFSFEREGVKLYMEIVGFWTMEYLLRKIEKLKDIEVSMLIAVDKNLACEKLASLEKQAQLKVIYYQDRIPLAPVLHLLREAFRETHSEQKRLVENLQVVFTEPIVEFEEFARRIGVSAEAARAVLTAKPPGDYVVLLNGLIRKDKLEQIRKGIDEQMPSSGRLPLTEAARIAEKEGVAVTEVIDALGYKIVWHGINTEKAEVFKPQKKSD
jgi:predicted nuclease of restriction endonuclease-like RecB superfamily